MIERVRHQARAARALGAGALAIAVVSCERVTSKPAAVAARADGAPVAIAIRVPPDSAIPPGALGAAIRRGRALLLDTRDSLPHNVGNALRCASCHLDGGTRAWSSPWIGVYARFPQYRSRSASVNVLEDRINDCFERSMNGTALAPASREMREIVAYMAFLSRGVPVGGEVEGQGFAKMTPLAGDTTRGARLYGATCTVCHGGGGEGTRVAPPVWGDGSFNIGAGMARVRTAAAFIRRNMPYDKPGTLSDAEAFDVAAYLVSRPRPDFPGKEHDWPNGDAPPDVAYRTLARKTTQP